MLSVVTTNDNGNNGDAIREIRDWILVLWILLAIEIGGPISIKYYFGGTENWKEIESQVATFTSKVK